MSSFYGFRSGFSCSHCYWFELIITVPESIVRELSSGFQELASGVDSSSARLSIAERKQH